MSGSPIIPSQHGSLIKFDLRYKAIHSAEVGMAGGLITKFLHIPGTERAFLKPALWIAASVFVSSSIVYGISMSSTSVREGVDKLEGDISSNVANALVAGAVYGGACRFLSHRCGNMGALKMAGVGAAITFAGELLAPVTTVPLFNAICKRI